MTFCGSFLIALLAIVSDLLLGLLERKSEKENRHKKQIKQENINKKT